MRGLAQPGPRTSDGSGGDESEVPGGEGGAKEEENIGDDVGRESCYVQVRPWKKGKKGVQPKAEKQ